MYEVTGRSATFGDVKIGTFEREVIGEENYMSAEAGTEEMENNVHTYLHLIEFDGGVKFGPVVEKETGDIIGVAVKALGADARDCLINALRFQLKVLEEERAEVDD